MKLISGVVLFLIYQTFAIDLNSDDENMPKSRDLCRPGSWVRSSKGEYPRGALAIGIDRGKIMYLIRVTHQGQVIPGKLHRGVAYPIWSGNEKKFPYYEVFCGGNGHWTWVRTSDKKIPPKALRVGKNANSRPFYICRANDDGKTVVGRVEKNSCHILNGNNLSKINNFDILVERN